MSRETCNPRRFQLQLCSRAWGVEQLSLAISYMLRVPSELSASWLHHQLSADRHKVLSVLFIREPWSRVPLFAGKIMGGRCGQPHEVGLGSIAIIKCRQRRHVDENYEAEKTDRVPGSGNGLVDSNIVVVGGSATVKKGGGWGKSAKRARVF
jgi:hypothetical protein